MKKFTYPLLIIVALLLGCGKKDLLPAAKRQHLDSLLQKANVTGLQLAYFEGSDKALYEFGYSSLSDSTRVSPSTIFQAAALSKPVTAALTLRLVDAGLIGLDQKVLEVYEEPRLSKADARERITVRHLLSHSSGLPNWGGDDLMLDFEPGSQWQYSGEGYVLLSKVLSTRMGKSFASLVDEWVFDPLAMSSSSFEGDFDPSIDLAVGHNMVQQPGQKAEPQEVNAASSLLTTASDYMKLLRGFSSSDFLSRSTRTMLQAQAIDANAWGAEDLNSYIAWSLVAGLQKEKDQVAMWQWGDNYLFRGMMMYYPATDRGLVYLTNSENGLSVADSLLCLVFSETPRAVAWLGYESFDTPERLSAIELEMAFLHEESGKAMAQYDRVFKEQPEVLTDNLINNIVWSLFAEKKLSGASQLIDQHLQRFPNSAEAHVRKGEALAFAHDYSASWQAYQKAMELDPSTSRVIMPRFSWYQEAWDALQSTDPRMALSAFVGQYGSITVSMNGNQLTYSDEQNGEVPLVRLSNDTFDLDNLETFRLRFVIEGERVTELAQSHLTGAVNSARRSEPET